MKAFLSKIKKQRVAGGYIASGLLKTAIHTLSGFVILRWLNPEELGTWQSFTVFVGYIQILTLGTTSGLNRELPFFLGKGENEVAMEKLKAGGYFTTVLSVGMMLLVVLLSIVLYTSNFLSLDNALMLSLAFSTASLTIQTSFLGATFRSSNAFLKLTNIQLFNTLLYVFLIPLVYFYNLWGYIAYQTSLAIFLYLGYFIKRPYKIKYKYNRIETIELIKVGFPIYFWNYISSVSRSIPRVILVLFGTPLLVGLFAPAASINAAMLNLPAYLNRYMFPQMSFKFGQTNSVSHVYNYSIKAAKILFILMMFGAVFLSIITPYLITSFFPKYIDGILAAQIVVFSGVFYSINALFHNTLNSIKVFKPFKYIISFRLVFILLFTTVFYWITGNLLLSVALGACFAEAGNLIIYYYFLKKSTV